MFKSFLKRGQVLRGLRAPLTNYKACCGGLNNLAAFNTKPPSPSSYILSPSNGTVADNSSAFIAWSQIPSSLHAELNQLAADNDKDGFIWYLQDCGSSDMNAALAWIYARHQSQLPSQLPSQDFDNLEGIWDWIRNDLMKDKASHALAIDFEKLPREVIEHNLDEYGWNFDEYLDAEYIKILNNLHQHWNHYINENKSVSRNGVYCIYGVSGSGKSRFLMEYSNKIKKDNPNILPIIITFADKCQYTPHPNTEKSDVWKAIISRIGFSLFGDNTDTMFNKISTKMSGMRIKHDSFIHQLTWEEIVLNTINYINKVNGTNYEGIILLIDEILRTDSDGREMGPQFLEIMRSGWDSSELTRKQLSFIFTTLHSYSWIKHETLELKRHVYTYYLPHFNDDTVCDQLIKTGIGKDRLKQALYSSTLINFRPRYLRDIIYNYKNNQTLKNFDKSNDDNINKKVLRIRDDLWEDIKNKSELINDKIFDLSFTNRTCGYDENIYYHLQTCDLVRLGVVIPYKNARNQFEISFVPQISLLSILLYLEDKNSQNNFSELEDKLFDLMKNFIKIGNSFELFQLLFETFRFNAFVSDRSDELQFAKYFGDKLYFCNPNNPIKTKALLFKKTKSKVEQFESFDEFMKYVNNIKRPERQAVYLLCNVIWFGGETGDEYQQSGFDSIIIYETNTNNRLWVFFESKYMKPKQEDDMTDFNNIINENNNLYDWFNGDDKLLIKNSDYKNIANREEKKSSELYNDVALWFESKHELIDHFGPTWKPIISHYIAYQYPQLQQMRQANLITTKSYDL